MSCKYCYQTDHTIENCKTIICKLCRDSGHPHWLCKKSKKGGNHKKGPSQKNQNETMTRNLSQSSISTQPSVEETSPITSLPPPPPVIIESNIGNSNKKTMASVLASSLQSKNKISSTVSTTNSSNSVSQNVTTVVSNTSEPEVCIEPTISETVIQPEPNPRVSNMNISNLFHNIETRNIKNNDTKRDLQFYLKQSKKRWSEIL